MNNTIHAAVREQEGKEYIAMLSAVDSQGACCKTCSHNTPLRLMQFCSRKRKVITVNGAICSSWTGGNKP